MDIEEIKLRLSRLTETERKVLQEFCKGFRYIDIGENLGYREGGIKFYMSSIFAKLELKQYKRGERRKILLEEFCPVLKSGEIKEPPPEAKPDDEKPITPGEEEEIEELQYEIIKVEPAEIVGPPIEKEDGKKTNFWWFLGGMLLMALICAGVFWAWNRFAPELTEEPLSEPPTSQVAENTPFVTVVHTQLVTEPVPAEDTPNPTTTSEILPSPTIPVPTATEIPSISLPFVDSFENGASPAWTVLNGNWLTANGRYTILGTSNAFRWSLLDEPSWENYRVTVKGRITNYRSGVQGLIAVAVRVQRTQSKYIGFYINSLTYGGWALIGTDRHTTDYISGKSSVIPQTFNLVLEVNGNQFTAFLDGRQYQQITFSGYDRGGVALGIACNFSSCTTFDEISIEAIGP